MCSEGYCSYPRRACAARVYTVLPSARMRSEGTVVGVCLCVCVSVTLNLTSRVSVRLTKDTTYLTGNEGQKICGIFSETAPLQS